MKSVSSWLRGHARRMIDGLFCLRSPALRRIGDADSGWVIHTEPMPVVSYCAGVGKGMSFELELAKRGDATVLVLDPSPTGISTVEKTSVSGLTFYPVGIAAKTGTLEFSLPSDPNEGSYSIPQAGREKTSFECWSLPTIMEKQNHARIDLLKMDIEGFEYDIIDRFLQEGTPIRQLCVEFHPWLKPGRTLRTIRKLYQSGYRIIHKHRGDYTFLRQQN